jgi:tRNA uridine 5-carbamoylmethylation protein Kti12
MAQLVSKVKKYLEANSKNWNNEQNNIILQNDGSGDYIHTWSVDSLAKPTDEQLASYNSSATTEENNNVIRATRKKSYGDIGNQLDEIYKDIDAWKARIKSIKDANPKE